MGSPQAPTPRQFADLERASELALLQSPVWQGVPNGGLVLAVSLPRQGISLLRLSW
jgi:xylan 1,4-beta-xylosidase